MVGVGKTRAMGSEDVLSPQDHRRVAVEANNSVWELLDGRVYTPTDVDELLARAYAAAYHWNRATDRGPANDARAAWLLSRCHAVLGHGDLALHHADRTLAVVDSAGLADFDLAYAHEARARALACLGRFDEANAELAAARAVPVAEADDRTLVESDIASEPWYGLSV